MARNLAKNTILKYKLIIDEWFVNRFNGAGAYRKFYPNIKSNATATVNFSKIQALPEIKEYIKLKHKKASEKLNLTQDELLKKIEGLATFDISNVVNLKTIEKKAVRRTVDEQATKELKKRNPNSKRKKYKDEEYSYYEQSLIFTDFDELTDAQRSSIKSVKEGRFGIEIEFQPKEKYIEMLNKHTGFYEIDNRQKAPQINYDSLDVDILNKIWDARTKPD